MEAHAVSRHEQLRRHQLEEDLRRMFLKNLTAMNMEAMSLFNFPPEYQYSIGGEAQPPRISPQVRRDLAAFVQGEREEETPRTQRPTLTPPADSAGP